jgi:hypothetical protein
MYMKYILFMSAEAQASTFLSHFPLSLDLTSSSSAFSSAPVGGCDALFTALVRVRDLNRYLRWEALVALLRQLCMYVAQGACLRLGYGLELPGSRAGAGAGAWSKQSSTQSRYISRLGGHI